MLHRYDWSEASLILDLFTREQGRLAVAAKGVKRPFSQQRAVLLPFQRILVSLGRVAGGEAAAEIQTLRAAEWAGGPPMLTGAALFAGFYLNELLMKLLARHDPHASLFDVYAGTLGSLGPDDDTTVQAALRAFELTLLREIGVLPDLSVVTSTQAPVEPGAGYVLLADTGVATAGRGDAGLTGAALTNLQAALDHGSLPALQQSCAATLPSLKTLLRAVLQHHLGSATLRTRQVLLGMQNLRP